MQIVRLEFEGIGPFAQRQVIDFEELSIGGLFLLEGPTGAGKSTIVDAMVFALYGDVAGSESSKGRIVSTMLPEGVEPFVDLTIDTSHGLLRVRRVPEYERVKKRGSGNTTVKASIKLWKLAAPDAAGVPVSTNIQEANDELSRAVGLTKSQFTQTVVLPQGQFATFLKAKPEDRRGILQDIFGTELYQRIANRLAEMAIDKRRAVDKAIGDVRQAAANFCQVAWYDQAQVTCEKIPEQVQFDDLVDDQEFGSLSELAAARLRVLADQADVLEDQVKAAAEQLHAAGQALEEAQKRNESITERDGLLARKRELASQAPGVKLKAERLTLADRAERVRHPLAEVSKSLLQTQECERALNDLVAAVSVGPHTDLVAELLPAEQYEQAQQAALTDAGGLEALVSDEASIPKTESDLSAAELALQLTEEQLRGRKEALTDASRGVGDLEAELKHLRDETTGLPDAVTAESQASGVLTAARKVEALTRSLTDLRKVEDEARASERQADSAYATARQGWLDSLAGTLASELADDKPCPVCGATEHPIPATIVTGSATRDEVDAFDLQRNHASKRRQQATSACDAAAARIEEQTKAAQGLSVDQATQAHAAAKGQLEHLQAAANRAGKIDEQLEKLREDNARETEEISAAEQDKATQDERNRIVRKHLEDLRSRVSIACDGHSTVAARMGALRHRASSAGCLAAAQRALSSARDNERLRAELLAAELEVCGFASATEAEEALLPELDRNDLRDHIEGHRRDSDQVEGSLQAPRLATLGDAATAPTDDLENAKAAAEEEVRTFTLTQGALTQTIKASRDALKDLDKTMAEFAGIERAAGPVVRMAELANAQQGNQLRMTLPTFVLLQRFEEVVDLANVRLSAMTDGRYQMRRTDAKEGRSQKLGLGLEVIDHASGDATREPQTLSGGETFKASLAMALGLADAVTAEAGGVELNTLFVDEGFGSLDPESLDAVMDQMTKLRQTGRTVGVISHVVEMKQRIAERVTVRPNGDGTSRLSCTVSEQVALRIGHNHSPSRLM